MAGFRQGADCFDRCRQHKPQHHEFQHGGGNRADGQAQGIGRQAQHHQPEQKVAPIEAEEGRGGEDTEGNKCGHEYQYA
ncbi:hypothetical protein AUK40_01285 [Candidatus Wirthbacteria bacterium CG2_30_54_11]|uniref:Uncharacterized protein n=1 Tax=Candidatus Wirthbacteria bacterium CG2_30_54_11 TaxID=1817892 RepID=A0A1J5INU0_9BACT|nr:MAG: hypothetical protein AUK40_01285 [Candidatus Wirthbacteria bacterium CG2_30_54_11]